MAVFSGARPSPSRPDAVFAAALPSPPKALSTFRVCFVDDESANCRLGLRMLARLGVPSQNIIVLADGNEAYDFMKRGVEVDVMLLDIRMPGVLLRPTRIVGNGRSPGAPLSRPCAMPWCLESMHTPSLGPTLPPPRPRFDASGAGLAVVSPHD